MTPLITDFQTANAITLEFLIVQLSYCEFSPLYLRVVDLSRIIVPNNQEYQQKIIFSDNIKETIVYDKIWLHFYTLFTTLHSVYYTLFVMYFTRYACICVYI